MGVINTIDLTGISAESWADAALVALRDASRTIRRIIRMDIVGTRAVVHDGVAAEYHTEVRIYFEMER